MELTSSLPNACMSQLTLPGLGPSDASPMPFALGKRVRLHSAAWRCRQTLWGCCVSALASTLRHAPMPHGPTLWMASCLTGGRGGRGGALVTERSRIPHTGRVGKRPRAEGAAWACGSLRADWVEVYYAQAPCSEEPSCTLYHS